MKVKQISVFLENKTGRLLQALRAIENEKINIRALSLADTAEFGILRLIVPNPDRAKKQLEKNNFTVGENDVIAVEVSDKPGGLAKLLGILDKAGINVEYIYAFVEKRGNEAVVVLKTENITEGIRILKEAGINLLSQAEIEKI